MLLMQIHQLSASFLSVWRLQTIVHHQAGWSPTFDPSWYGPISMLLGVLEVNVASICASVPIFWPVLSPYLGTIFVTREISVQVQHESHEDQVAIIGDDAKSLSNSKTTTPSYKEHGRGDSETELTPMGNMNSHYNNEYVMGQVDPLRTDRVAPTSVINSGSNRSKRRWFQV